jgi:hypothetical protein
MFFQDGLTGSAWGDWANYTESPLRAFENELGVQVLPNEANQRAIRKFGQIFSLYTELSDFSGYHQEDVTTC